MTRTSLDERAAQIAAKLAAGHRRRPAEAMANSGRRRTPEKRALLERIVEVRGRLEAEPNEPGRP